jgi:hypothetical protein
MTFESDLAGAARLQVSFKFPRWVRCLWTARVRLSSSVPAAGGDPGNTRPAGWATRRGIDKGAAPPCRIRNMCSPADPYAACSDDSAARAVSGRNHLTRWRLARVRTARRPPLPRATRRPVRTPAETSRSILPRSMTLCLQWCPLNGSVRNIYRENFVLYMLQQRSLNSPLK